MDRITNGKEFNPMLVFKSADSFTAVVLPTFQL